MKTLFILVFLSVTFIGNVYSQNNPCENNIVNPKRMFEAMQSISGITEAEFCNCYECLCCNCMGQQRVKKDNNPCPPVDKIVSKICCVGTSKETVITWHCCEIEPPCPEDCCDDCDLNNCPPPNIRGRFYLHLTVGVSNFENYLRLFSGIVKEYGGKTCCEEYLEQHPSNCQGMQNQGIVSVYRSRCRTEYNRCC